MKIENYKGNREYFNKVARKSKEDRKKIERIKHLKEKSDEELEGMITNALMSGIYSMTTILMLNGTIETKGSGKVIWPILSILVVYLGIAVTKEKYKQRKSYIEEANQLIKDVIRENPDEGLTL